METNTDITFIVVVRAGTKLVTVETTEPTSECAMVTAMGHVWDKTGVEPEDQKVVSCIPKAQIH